MRSSLRRLLVPVLGVVATLGAPVLLRYGTLFTFMAYVTLLLTAFTFLGFRWLWRSAPTPNSARAVRTLVRMFWSVSGGLAGIAVAAGIWFSSPMFLILPLPFFFPALTGSIFHERTFRRIDDVPFWRKGL